MFDSVCVDGGVNSAVWTSLTRIDRNLVELISEFLAHNISSVLVYGGKNARVNIRKECEYGKKCSENCNGKSQND